MVYASEREDAEHLLVEDDAVSDLDRDLVAIRGCLRHPATREVLIACLEARFGSVLSGCTSQRCSGDLNLAEHSVSLLVKPDDDLAQRGSAMGAKPHGHVAREVLFAGWILGH